MFVDSNIWCYYFKDSTEEHEAVSNFLEQHLGISTIVINVVVAMEVAHFLVKNLGPIDGGKKVELFLSSPLDIFPLDLATLKWSVEWLKRYSHVGIGGRDATILATMQKYNVNCLVTHDQAFQRVSEITVIDPIEKSR